jgi:hypothetical protein
MKTFTRDEALALMLSAFPPVPLPKITDDRIFYSSAYAFDWLGVRDKTWIEVSKHKVESFVGFSSVAGEIPAKYYFYYLPAVWIAVFDNLEFFDTVYRSLLPSHYYKIDQRWLDYLSVLNSKQIDILICFLKKCRSSIDLYENVMELDILIEALEKI